MTTQKEQDEKKFEEWFRSIYGIASNSNKLFLRDGFLAGLQAGREEKEWFDGAFKQVSKMNDFLVDQRTELKKKWQSRVAELNRAIKYCNADEETYGIVREWLDRILGKPAKSSEAFIRENRGKSVQKHPTSEDAKGKKRVIGGETKNGKLLYRIVKEE